MSSSYQASQQELQPENFISPKLLLLGSDEGCLVLSLLHSMGSTACLALKVVS